MDVDVVRPIVSGLVGATVAGWLLSRLSRWVPVASEGKSAETLLAENRTRIFIANALFLLSLVGAIFVYRKGYFPANDWRAAGLGFGAACIAPVLWLYLSTLNGGARRTQEAFVAYAISQRTPPVLLYGLLFLGFISFFAAAASLAVD